MHKSLAETEDDGFAPTVTSDMLHPCNTLTSRLRYVIFSKRRSILEVRGQRVVNA